MFRHTFDATRRGSRSAPAPEALVFKDDLLRHDRWSLQTPPPSAADALSFNKGATIDSVLTASNASSTRTPDTPISPYAPIAGWSHRRHAKQESRDQELEAITSNPRSYPSQQKRTRVEDASDEAALPPTKRQLTAADLIHNPFSGLHRYEVPAAYVQDQLLRATSQRFNQRAGAVAYIRAKHTGNSCDQRRLRVRVTPHHDKSAAFNLSFRSQGRATADSKPKHNSSDHTKDFLTSSSLPLHTEAALLRLPLIGRLLLSGKVFVGDLIEVELPHPEVFSDTMYWVYTGNMRIETEAKICENLDALAGLP